MPAKNPKGKAAPPARSPNVPLALRVPNAPARFVGRAEALRRARDLLRRGPLVIVTGAAGLGKSALMSCLLHEHFTDRAPSAVYVSLGGGDPEEPTALVVARALARAAGARDVEWSEVLGNAEALGALAIDLAADRCVVLDDLGAAPPADVALLLRQIARYARQSKWIAALPTAPAEGDLIEHVLSLGPMPDAEMRLLARSLAPSLAAAEVAALVAGASGSPQRLRQRLAGGPALETRSDPPAEGIALLRTLALFTLPIPEAILARIDPASPAILEALSRAHWIERSRAGVIVPEHVRGLVPASSADDRRARAEQAAAALSIAEDPALHVEALRLWLVADRPDEAARMLAQLGDDLVATGYAARIHHLLEDAPHPALDAWRLRVAADLGDAAVLDGVRPPSSDSLEAHYHWARLLLGKRRFDEAIAIAARVQAEAEQASDHDLSFSAGLLRAQSIGNRGAMRACVDLLDTLAPPDAVAAAQRDAFAAMALAIDGRRDEALARGDALRARLEALPPPVRRRAGYRLAQAYNHAGRPRDAAQILDDLLTEGRGSVRLAMDRVVRFARAGLLLDGGQIEAGRTAIAELEPYVARASLLGVHLDIARATACFAEGAVDHVDRFLANVIARDPGPHVMAEVETLVMRARVLRRDASIPPSTQLASVFGETYALARAELDLRAGRLAPADAMSATATLPSNLEIQLAARTLRAHAHLLANDATAAARDAGAAVEIAREHGYGVRAAEAKQCQCDALLVAAQWDALDHHARELASMAAAMPSPRFEGAARFFLLAAASGPLDAAALEALAQHAFMPDVALRARALLGATVALDAVDRAVLAALLSRAGKRAPDTILHPDVDRAWRPGFGLDEAARHVWLPSGARIDLSRQSVEWRILASLVARGGSATKEALTLSVWSEREYHPLRHDNRLQAAVRKLRLAIEDDAKAPARIITTEDGYALGGVVRLLRA
ncbi:Flagellar hook-length control protein FliK [Minicystis rosea]|nr:Flagellar hook-length control protein FliK [Minicystis rosea]